MLYNKFLSAFLLVFIAENVVFVKDIVLCWVCYVVKMNEFYFVFLVNSHLRNFQLLSNCLNGILLSEKCENIWNNLVVYLCVREKRTIFVV